MKITNKHGLPQPLVVAAMDDQYSRGESDISVTQLIDAPRRRIMNQAYGDQAEQDVSTRVWAMLGQSFHTLMERGGDEHDCILEERLFHEFNGWVLSGAIDRVNDITSDAPVLQDYKVTSVFTVMSMRPEWEEQLNCYLHLFRRTYMARDTSLTLPNLEIIALCRDWRPNEIDRMQGYPRAPVQKIRIPQWTEDYAEHFIQQRIAMHQEAQRAFDDDGVIAKCTEKDMWTRPDQFAGYRDYSSYVMGIKAVKIFNTEKDAQMARGIGYVRRRFGKDVRCDDYCEFKHVCTQHKEREVERNAEAAYQEIMGNK